MFLAGSGWRVSHFMNFKFFRKMEVVRENSFYGELAEWTKASAMLNDVNRNSERSFKHRRFESCTLHKYCMMLT